MQLTPMPTPMSIQARLITENTGVSVSIKGAIVFLNLKTPTMIKNYGFASLSTTLFYEGLEEASKSSQ